MGACIVSPDNIIISTGYNGLPNGCSMTSIPGSGRRGNQISLRGSRGTQRHFKCQRPGLAGSRLYVALFPCNECAKAIIQAGVKEVLYLSDKYASTAATRPPNGCWIPPA